MGRGIVRLVDPATDAEYFMEWSTIVDAPVTDGMSEEELVDYIREEYGKQGVAELPSRIARARETGTSFHRDDLEGVICCNRGHDKDGKWNEERWTEQQILEYYCLRER